MTVLCIHIEIQTLLPALPVCGFATPLYNKKEEKEKKMCLIIDWNTLRRDFVYRYNITAGRQKLKKENT